jgi:nitrate reductase assembly molybdenum cofactor insertion protein NarJ
MTHALTYVTAEELDQIGQEILTILYRYRDRTLDRSRRPPDSAPVQLVAYGHPLVPSPSGS